MFISGALYPIEDAQSWADKYGLDIPEVKCMNCNAPMELTRPWATIEFRGLLSMPCEHCDETRVPFTFIQVKEVSQG